MLLIFLVRGLDRFCNGGLPSDLTVSIEGVTFHLHKVPAFLSEICSFLSGLLIDEIVVGFFVVLVCLAALCVFILWNLIQPR